MKMNTNKLMKKGSMWTKEKQLCHVDDWMKMMFNDESKNLYWPTQ